MMVDTEHVLEQLRAANPAPSLEQLAVDDLDLVRNIVARERSATTPVTEPPQTRPDLPTPQRRMRPILVTGLAFILMLGTLGAALLLFRGSNPELAGSESTIAAGSACPLDVTPDFTTFDPGTGQALILAEGEFCMFDVRTNTWTAAPQPGEIGPVTDFVYDVDSGSAIAFAEDRAVAVPTYAEYLAAGVQVWAYGPDGQGWSRKNDLTIAPAAVQAVYDPVTGLVVVRATTSQMWTYDVDTDTWTEVDQGATLPPADARVLTYDASVDRLILYDAHLGNTWEFDIRAGRWEKQATNTPNVVDRGWGPHANDFIYDEANQVSVIYGGGTQPYVATYDASEHSWTEVWTIFQPLLISGVDPSREVVLGPAMTYDPVNERILVPGWPANSVFAFDVATREWILLLEPTFGPTLDFNTTFDPGTGQALILAGSDFCMFDVRTNTWTAAPQFGEIGPVTDFVYDVDSGSAIAFAEHRAVAVQVWA